jgi:hypothetical protein
MYLPQLHVRKIGLRAGLNVMQKRNISYIYKNSNPDSSVVQPVA